MEYEQDFKEYLVGKELIKIQLNELNVDDIVYITFCPYSQKYLDELTPKYGKVVSIGKKYHEFIIKSPFNFNIYLFHDCVSYYGDSLGYAYDIYLVK